MIAPVRIEALGGDVENYRAGSCGFGLIAGQRGFCFGPADSARHAVPPRGSWPQRPQGGTDHDDQFRSCITPLTEAETPLHDASSYLARSSDPCNPASSAWKIELEQAKNLATSGSISGGPARVRGWTTNSVTPHCLKIDNPIGANGLSRYRGSIYVVTVSTKFTYPSLGFLALLKLRLLVISASYSQRAIELR